MHSEKTEELIVAILKSKNYTLTTAESCTGGLLSARIIDVSGASDVYNEGHITYSDSAKEKYLNVSLETLEIYGAVSRQTAKEMACGAAKLANADTALSVTGFAGPSGGADKVPIGTVYIGCFFNGTTVVEHYVFTGDRKTIRNQAVDSALDLLYKCLSQ